MPAECAATSADNVFCQRVRFFVAFPNGDFVLPLPHIARESIELFFGYVWFVAVFCNDLAASICRRTCISRISEQATQHIGCPLVGFCIIRLSQNSLFVSHWGFNGTYAAAQPYTAQAQSRTISLKNRMKRASHKTSL